MIVLLNVYIICALRKKCVPLLLGTMANSQADRAPPEVDKIGAVVKVRILLGLGIV